MSANNWAVCPKCKARREEEVRDMDIDLAEAYGTVSIEEFDRMRAVRDAKQKEDLEATLREDYEIWGVASGEFHVSYGGHCTACGFAHTFEHNEVLDLGGRS